MEVTGGGTLSEMVLVPLGVYSVFYLFYLEQLGRAVLVDSQCGGTTENVS